MRSGELTDVHRLLRRASGFAGVALACLSAVSPATAEHLENGVAVFSALDKVTATIKKLEIKLNDTIEFGSLKVTPRACYSRPPTEQPKTTSFVEVDEVQLDGSQKRIFSGWMFAESPGLNAVEHPVFDVWLTECQKPKNVAQRNPQPQGAPAPAAPGVEELPPDDQSLEPRRRVRR